MIKFDVFHRFSGKVQFTAEIDCDDAAPHSIKLGLAIKWAIKTRADLTYARLTGADLTDAKLTRADLTYADLTDAKLTRADLTRADLTRADLTRADLTDAKLTGADLTRADLTDAKLTGARLNALTIAKTCILPEGDLIGWKKCRNGVLAKLRIPAEARRSNSTGRKCRAEFVDVLEVIGAEVGVSEHDVKTEYVAGQRVTCDTWCENRWKECGGGIHFWITKEEALAW